MKTATRLFWVMLLAALWVMPASAQTERNVTFQVDMTAAIDAGVFDIQNDSVLVRGSMNDWSNSGQVDHLRDGDGDGVYAGTLSLFQDSTYTYKFWASPESFIGYEDGDNRSYSVSDQDNQMVDVVDFNKAIGGTLAKYEIEFRVDMGVASLSDKFNPGDGDFVVVAGSINGWSTTSDTLTQDFVNPNLYAKVVRYDALVPDTVKYKFVIGKPGGNPPGGWEGVDDRPLALSGNEEDIDGSGFLDVTNGDTVPYFDNVGPEDVLTEEVTVTFEVDLRPAFYHLADSSRLPNDTQTGDPVTELNSPFINGPAAGAGDGLTDWATWGADLAAIDSRKLVDDGTNGDAVAGDSVFTVQFTYSAGTARKLVAKYGTDGADNEAGFGGNHNLIVDPANPTIRTVYGAVLQANGKYTDDNGPTLTNPGDYDPYIRIDNAAGTVEAVRRGGEDDGINTSIEVVDGEVPEGFKLEQNYPNPFNPSTSIEYTIPASQHVTLTVFDITGRVVATLVDQQQSASTYRVTFDATNMASGMYIYQLKSANVITAKTMVLLK